MTSRPHEDTVLAAALQSPQVGGLLDIALQASVDESYFSDTKQHLWQAAVASSILGRRLDEDMLNAMLQQKGLQPDECLRAIITFRDLAQVQVDRVKLRVVLPAFKESVHEDRLAGALEEAANVLSIGSNVDGTWTQGYRQTRSLLMRRLTELEQRESSSGVVAEEIRANSEAIWNEYQAVKTNPRHGIHTGFHAIDSLTGGIAASELWIICGYTSHGKSQFLLNVAYHAALEERKHVVFISFEMPMEQVRRRLVVRHSNHRVFNMPLGLSYTKLKKGAFDYAEEAFFRDVVTHFGLAEPDDGRLTILELAKSETITSLRERLTYVRARHPIDLLVIDYASLMSSTRRRSERRDEIVEVIEGLKSLALTFNEGEGLRILTANQISRKAAEEAEQAKKYGQSFASETSAIEKNADWLGWILRTNDLAAAHEVTVGIAKYRDGDVGTHFNLFENYDSSLLQNLTSGPVP